MCNCEEFKTKGKCKFHNKDGTLTQYALACGYIEKTVANDTETILYWDSCCYQVKQYDFGNHKRLFWESYTSLTEARKAYNVLVKENK